MKYKTEKKIYDTVYSDYALCFRLGNEEQQPEVPILYHDVTSLLLVQILMMPQPLRKGMSL